jgi:hypothetical protein
VLALDPAALAAEFKGPILVINGAADRQVSAQRDAARFASVLAVRKDGSEVVTPASVSHNLKTVSVIDDQGFSGDVDSKVKELIVRWVRDKL